MPHKKTDRHRINLVAGAILVVMTLLVGITVFIVMERHAEMLLRKGLESSLENRAQLIRAELDTGLDKTMVVATLPLLKEQIERVNAGKDDGTARSAIDKVAHTLLPIGFTAMALLDREGRELARSGVFSSQPTLSVLRNFNGQARLLWDGQLLLQATVGIHQEGDVIGTVVTETRLAGSTDILKNTGNQGKTTVFALCASLGANMQCLSSALGSKVSMMAKQSANGDLVPVAHAVEGRTGFIIARDNRNHEVAAAYAPLDDLGLVLKMDRAEFYEPVWSQLRYLIPLLAGLLVIALLLLRWRLAPLVLGLVRSEAQAREMSASLLDKEHYERVLLDNLDEAIVSISDSGMIELFNPAAERMFGYRSEDVVGKNVSMLMPEPYHSEHDGHLRRYLHTGQAHIIGKDVGRELMGRRSDGSVFPMVLRISEFYLEGRRQFIGSMRDITERKRITEALHASEKQLREITDTVPAVLAYLDREQRFRFHNKACEELLGRSFGQIDGHTLAEVLGQPAYEEVQDKVEKVLQGHPVRYEFEHITPQSDHRSYAMHYVPRYGEGKDKDKVLGFFASGSDITELKRIGRMKTEFVSIVSHELRTPLTSIRGSLGLIAGGVAGELPEVVKNLVGIAKNNCERLIRLINGILDIEKIESGKMRLELQVVTLEPLLQEVMSDNEGFAVQHRVKLRLQGPDAPLKLRADRDRLIQVLTNLLSNAVKFSPPEDVVEVKVLRVAQGVRIEVVDHGPGIAEEFRSRIFRKFSQADSSDTRQKGGSGLGLNISKAIIDQMGGQIGFLSEPGAGATFFLELPEWQDPAPLIARKPGQLPRQGIIGGKPLVLHVEDNPDIQQLTAAVAHEVADFEFAATLNEARLRLSEQRFDLVVLDLGLGEESGWDLLGDINALFPRPPVIVFSARDAGRVEGKQIEAVLLQSHTTNAELLHAIERALRIPAEH